MVQRASLMPSRQRRRTTPQGVPEFMATIPHPFPPGLAPGLRSMASGKMLEACRMFERVHAAAAPGAVTDAQLLLLVCRAKLEDANAQGEAALLMERWSGFARLTATELFAVAALLDYLPGSAARKKAAHAYAKLFLDMDCGPNTFWPWFKNQAAEIVARTQQALGAQAGAEDSNSQPVALDVAARWRDIVAKTGVAIPAMDKLLEMTGLEPVKEQFLGIYHWVCIAQRRGESVHEKRLNVVLAGNPGTGKTTVARLYGEFLVSLGVLSGSAMEETTGARLVQGGVDELKELLEAIEEEGGGVLFIDEAYQLNPKSEMYGRRVLDYLLAEVENKIGKLVVALAGYKSKMEALFEHNEGLPERFPYKFAFEDYEDSELMAMLQKRIVKKIPSPDLSIEGGMDGKPMRILIRRLGHGRGKEGFGNARAVANLWDRIMVRQATRLAGEAARGVPCNDYEFKREDLLGPDVRLALATSASYKALQGMIGMTAVKAAVDGMVKVIETNVEREEREEPLLRMSLNRVFLGNPGTGKTTVAKHYAGILKDLGLLSKGEVIVKGPSDFVGTYPGQSEERTASVLKAAAGSVLVIDEAYGLFASGPGGGPGQDPQKQAVVDTLVAKVQNVPGEDLAVLMLGYREQMEEFLTKANPGLARRFALEDAFVFEDYTDDELLKILSTKLSHKGLQASFSARSTAVECLAKQRRRPNFGNGGAVENLISSAVMRLNARLGALPPLERALAQELTSGDFDPDLATLSLINGGDLSAFFAELLGCAAAKHKLAEYKSTVELAHKRGVDPLQDLNLCFRFVGAPGTGKTTVARKMGAIFKSLGILGDGRLVEVSATDLIGQYVGQTGPKTRDKLREALDRVLFIDEAYRLNPQHSSFAGEALNEIVDALTKPQFHNKLVVVLAGYPREIHELVQANPGLSSRFKEIVEFEDFSSELCLAVLKEKLKGAYALPPGTDGEVKAHFENLMKVPGWGNGRDVDGLRKQFQNRAAHRIVSGNIDMPAGGIIQLERDDVFPALEQLLRERIAYAPQEPHQAPLLGAAPGVAMTLAIVHCPARAPAIVRRPPPSLKIPRGLNATGGRRQADKGKQVLVERDVGVTDEAWAKLQQHKEDGERRRVAAEEAKRRLEEEARRLELEKQLRLEQEAKERARLEEEARRKEAERQAIEAAQREEMRRLEEEARRLEEQLRLEQEARERARLEEELRRQEAERQAIEAAQREEMRRLEEEARRLELEKKLRLEQEARERARLEEELRRQEAERQAIEAAQREEMRRQQRLRELGRCCMGYNWIRISDAMYQCAGGSHFASVSELA
eukprot:jgi/Mesvir1/5522/Mv15562-RA.1